MKTPNIFHYAADELSQDAVICYFAAWGDPRCQSLPLSEEGKASHSMGAAFLHCLLQKCGVKGEKILEVAVHKQYNHIDVLLLITMEAKKYALVIEDKTSASQHGSQLERYKKFVETHPKFSEYEVHGIYFKKGNQSGLNKAVKAGYHLFLREDMLAFFARHEAEGGNQNTIYREFAESITAHDKLVNSWKTSPIKEWGWHSWEGFYAALESAIGKRFVGWDYVSNPSGGFLGCWWGWNNWSENEIYLQIEQGNFVFKMESSAENKGASQWQWHEELLKAAAEQGLKEIKKPNRMRSGAAMTCAVVERKDWLGPMTAPSILKRWLSVWKNTRHCWIRSQNKKTVNN